MVSPVLLTGATGALGMQVLDRVLEESDRPVLACVRATDAALRFPDRGLRRLDALLRRRGSLR
jgi:thioester reductase-like protein